MIQGLECCTAELGTVPLQAAEFWCDVQNFKYNRLFWRTHEVQLPNIWGLWLHFTFRIVNWDQEKNMKWQLQWMQYCIINKFKEHK